MTHIKNLHLKRHGYISKYWQTPSKNSEGLAGLDDQPCMLSGEMKVSFIRNLLQVSYIDLSQN